MCDPLKYEGGVCTSFNSARKIFMISVNKMFRDILMDLISGLTSSRQLRKDLVYCSLLRLGGRQRVDKVQKSAATPPLYLNPASVNWSFRLLCTYPYITTYP